MTNDPIDYDIHGLAGVRLVDAGAREAAAVDRQLGPTRAALAGAPDIVVRFVDRIDVRGPVRLLGLDEGGFTDDAFLVLRSRHKTRTRVQIDFATIGRGGEIVCERGAPAVPLLIAILNLTILGNGALPLHASAFEHDGTGIVVTGWSKGGKTEAMLAFMARGARFVGDEWVYVQGDGMRVHGLPEPMRLWDWHLRQLPEFRARIGAGDRARLEGLRGAAALAGGRVAPRVVKLLERQRHVDFAPERLFAPESIALSGRFDHLFLLGSWEAAQVTARPIEPGEVARRMAFSLTHERGPLVAYYEQFRFAFPERSNPLLDDAPRIERELLGHVFAGKPAHAVDHPYPVALDELFEAMRAQL